jgi:carbamoyl-phosphate synthase large subunit
MTHDAVDEPRRIIVTGVGGAPGFDLARKLLDRGHHVIALDCDPLASGLLLPGVAARVAPRADETIYASWLLELCRQLRPDALLSTVESELPTLRALSRTLDTLQVRTWLPPDKAMHASLDKLRFHAVLVEHGVPTPPTWLPDQIDQIPDGCDLVVKPRRGQGSRDVVFCWTREQARAVCEVIVDPLVQQRLHGQEFTADCLIDRGGRASVILRRRLLTKGGLAHVASTFHDGQVAETVTSALAAVGAEGLCCVQGFLPDEPGGEVVLTEMNARIAGGFPLAEAAGADLVGQALEGLWGRPIHHDLLEYTDEVFLTKYCETLAVGSRPDHTAQPAWATVAPAAVEGA